MDSVIRLCHFYLSNKLEVQHLWNLKVQFQPRSAKGSMKVVKLAMETASSGLEGVSTDDNMKGFTGEVCRWQVIAQCFEEGRLLSTGHALTVL